MGVDVTNIIKDLALTDVENVTVICLEIKTALENDNYEDLIQVLERLQTELDKDIARRVYAGKEGAYQTPIQLLKKSLDDTALLEVTLKTLTSFMTGNPDLLDSDGIELQMKVAVHMAELLCCYGEIDYRVRPLIFTIRHWAQHVGITNPALGRWITNISITFLVLFYLQLKRILPFSNEFERPPS
ncbi:speckle targeted PIP5K1A-regulated poly(A) polymerase-like [Venturia canescens]|uniref:speckle targeted PIP5K1A-regulated poly(A) polymerase-like n=1 Tax=Venturia canescens TaxID=32260 RepID=UPI001C9D1C1D|nr:speckle targeted PIP5K1A-regulated poly(A) polymerase-like [Venturia canescens]XP_043275104.1 speckle targeted PIP5K1A-regulated poly(A) polymerase-like [Venturia canescens]